MTVSPTARSVPSAEEWGVAAAPFLLNLAGSPAHEDFNGASMVMPGYLPSPCLHPCARSFPMRYHKGQ